MQETAIMAAMSTIEEEEEEEEDWPLTVFSRDQHQMSALYMTVTDI